MTGRTLKVVRTAVQRRVDLFLHRIIDGQFWPPCDVWNEDSLVFQTSQGRLVVDVRSLYVSLTNASNEYVFHDCHLHPEAAKDLEDLFFPECEFMPVSPEDDELLKSLEGLIE